MSLSVDTVFLFLIVRVALAWNFSDVRLPQDVLIWRFTIWRNKAYLAVPRWDKNTEIPSTLLEAPWPEAGNLLQIGATATDHVLPFPNAKAQQEGVCRHLQSVTGLDVDARGKLWVLDAPTGRGNRCAAKILLFDLRRNEKVTETVLLGVSPRQLKCLVVDPVVSQRGPLAYVGDAGDGSIIVYSLGLKKWWRLKLSGEFNVPRIFSTDLAVSRKSSVMYLTGYPSTDLFSVDLESIRLENESTHTAHTNVSWVGSKMGTSLGLICDLRGGLHYFMVTEVASVRWDTRQDLAAEGHAILMQSELAPCITDYALDSQKNVWGIVNYRNPQENSISGLGGAGRWRKTGTGNCKRSRTVKIYKFNPFFV